MSVQVGLDLVDEGWNERQQHWNASMDLNARCCWEVKLARARASSAEVSVEVGDIEWDCVTEFQVRAHASETK